MLNRVLIECKRNKQFTHLHTTNKHKCVVERANRSRSNVNPLILTVFDTRFFRLPSLVVAKAAAPALFFLYPALKAGLWIMQHSINVVEKSLPACSFRVHSHQLCKTYLSKNQSQSFSNKKHSEQTNEPLLAQELLQRTWQRLVCFIISVLLHYWITPRPYCNFTGKAAGEILVFSDFERLTILINLIPKFLLSPWPKILLFLFFSYSFEHASA